MSKKKKKTSFQHRKAGISGMWKKAKKQVEESPDMFGTVEKGRYLVKLVSAVVTEIGDRNWKNFAFGFEIQEGDSEGTIVTRRCGLETEENFTFLIRDFQRLDVDTNDLEINSEEELNELGKQLVEAAPICRVRITEPNDQGFQNTYIDKLIESESSGGNGGESDADDLVGTTMGFKKGKKMLVGKILSVDKDDDTFVMKTDAGKKVTGDIGDLESPEEEPDDNAFEEGDRVQTEIDGTTYEGEVTSVGKKDADVTFDDGDKLTVKFKELEKIEGGEAGNLEVGDKVIVEYKGKDVKAKVKAIDDDDNEATVMLIKLKKKITVSLDEIYETD